MSSASDRPSRRHMCKSLGVGTSRAAPFAGADAEQRGWPGGEAGRGHSGPPAPGMAQRHRRRAEGPEAQQ